ncbi:MAG: enoyl-CoA hydratase/isomerase family protein [Anaerovoracaceae bacterium]
MKEISYTVENGIALMKIDRPKALNALSRTIVDDMNELLEEIKMDTDIKVLVIHNEENFAAGADIGGMVECDEESAKEFSFSPVFNKLEALEIPTIAAIEGYALGGGLELALACDMRIASEDAKLGFPEINLGIMPGAGGTVRAARLIGAAKAKELILMGGTISACQAEEIGLVNMTVSRDELLSTALKWADKIAQKGAIAVRTAKMTINAAAAECCVTDGIDIESRNWAALFNTEDQKEGMRAFLEKRKPVYKGK